MYQTSPGSRFTKPKSEQKPQRQSTTNSKTSNVSRFPQARLLVLLLRQIFNNKIRRIFDRVKTVEKPRYRYLNVIQKIENTRLRVAFEEIRMYGRKITLTRMGSQLNQSNIRVFLIALLHKLYLKNLKCGTNRLIASIHSQDISQETITNCFNRIAEVFGKRNTRQGWRKIVIWSQRGQSSKVGAVVAFRRGLKLYNKNLRNGMSAIQLVSSHRNYQALYSASQNQRKRFYDYENNKRQHMANQRQNMHNLKQMIDNMAHQKSVKMGEMKRQKSIKINQLQFQIKNLEKKLQESLDQFNCFERVLGKLQILVTQRQHIKQMSDNAMVKVHKIFNNLKYQDEAIEEPQSSSLVTIVLNKQKFRSYLSQLDDIKSSVESLLVYMNIKRRNLICQYEGVSIESIKLSQQYLLAFEENTALKEVVNSLISYDLLKDQGDTLLKENNNKLEQLFSSYFAYADKEQSAEGGSQVRQSFMSIKSTKSLKKKSSLGTSVFSNRSIK